MFSGNLSNLEKNQKISKNQKMFQKIKTSIKLQKIYKKSLKKYNKKHKKNPENPLKNTKNTKKSRKYRKLLKIQEMSKLSKNQKISINPKVFKKYLCMPKNLKKKTYFFSQYQEYAIRQKKLEEKNVAEEKKAIFLVFHYQEDAIRPELSSPARFRFQGGSPKHDGRTDGRTKS